MKRVVLVAVPALVLGAANLSAQAARPAAPPAAGATTRVQMKQQGQRYLFEPANFTVKQGDVAEFVNVSGFPHNVEFEAGKVPAGAADVLNRNMTNRLGPLQGPMMTTANQTYRVSFAGAPAGTYDYFCLPHKALNMKGVVTVQAGAAAPARR